jgi:hypothetical protein
MGQRRKVPATEAVATLRPVNRTAALVTQRGPKGVELENTIAQVHSDVALPMRPFTGEPNLPNLTGHVFGTLTVMGLWAHKTEAGALRWVCRCRCGSYLTRSTKAIRNPQNARDACDKCRHLAYLKKATQWRATGIDGDQNSFILIGEKP